MTTSTEKAILPDEKRDILVKVGKIIKYLRGDRNLNQTKLAKSAGLSVSMISQMENGSKGWSSDSLERVAAALEVPVSTLLRAEFLDPDMRAFIHIERKLMKEKPERIKIATNLLASLLKE